MADRPFSNFFAARDALDAEILAGKLELSATQNAVFRFLLEHALYKPSDERDVGFVIESVLGVPAICQLTSLKPTAVKEAIKSLKDMRLIRTFKRPVMSGGRKPDRIRIEWMLPEEPFAVSSHEPGNAPSYGTPAVPSYQPENVPSIYRKQELLEERPQEGVGRDQGQSHTQRHPAGARRDEFDSLLAACPDSVLDLFLGRMGGIISVKQSYGYFSARPEVGRLREDLARFQADSA